MSVTFTAVLGVAGRPVFKNMLDSLQRNMGPGDQVIVVVDSFEWGPKPEVHDLVHSYGPQFECYAYNAGYHFLGAEQMNYAFRNVPLKGTHILALADDDVLVDGAYDTYRAALEPDTSRPLLPRFVCPFGIDFATGQIHGDQRCVLWDIPRMQIVRITSAVVFPQRFLQMWPVALDCCSDYYWMETILAAAKAEGHDPLWLDYVSIIARPDQLARRGDDIVHQGVWICDACNGRDAGTGWGFIEDGTTCICGAAGRTIARIVEGRTV